MFEIKTRIKWTCFILIHILRTEKYVGHSASFYKVE
jgi:hypothetical protein